MSSDNASEFRKPAPAVPELELVGRLLKIRHAMQDDGLDAIVLSDKKISNIFLIFIRFLGRSRLALLLRLSPLQTSISLEICPKPRELNSNLETFVPDTTTDIWLRLWP